MSDFVDGPNSAAPVTFFIIILYFESPATTSRLVKHIHLVGFAKYPCVTHKTCKNEHEKDRQRCRSFLYLYLILYCIYVESANIRMFD